MLRSIMKETLSLISTLDAKVECQRLKIGSLRGGVDCHYEVPRYTGAIGNIN